MGGDEAARLVDLGARREAIIVTGDTRYDQVWDRAQRVDRTGALLGRLSGPRLTIVAGSTWPADERVLLPAFVDARGRFGGARLVVAPHEPTADHLAPIEHWARAERLQLDRLDHATVATDVVLVDRVGVLGDLYALADVAFVGGGFHDAGLHSVLEPAAFGTPVLFGPKHARNPDAGPLAAAGGGFEVGDRRAVAVNLVRLLRSQAEWGAAGEESRDFVKGGLGAAER